MSKARLDYDDKLLPIKSNILDTIKHFIDLINAQQAGNIIKVVRIKNRFKNVSSNISLQLFDYCDTLLYSIDTFSWMTIIGHSFYVFERKKEYFNYLNEMNNKLLNNNATFIKNILQTQILSQNKNMFSWLLHLLNEKEYKLLID